MSKDPGMYCKGNKANAWHSSGGASLFGKSLSRKLSILSSVQHNVCRALDPRLNVTLECLGCMGSCFCPTTYNLKHKV